MNSLISRLAQIYLKDLGLYRGDIDGIFGPMSRTAAVQWWRSFSKSPVYADVMRITLAQRQLAKERFYQGRIDGILGQATKAAVARWGERIGLRPEQAPDTPYVLAQSYIGTKEIPGKQDNPIIIRWLRTFAAWVSSEETAWCSAFVNAMAKATGFERSGKLNARSWLGVGEPIDLADARPGDVVILWRKSLTAWEGHVGFLDHFDRRQGQLWLLGGNQYNSSRGKSDEVNVSPYPVSRLLGVRRLKRLPD